MHSDIGSLNGIGIEVRYLAYPRAGLDSRSYARMVSAWCADNPHEALTTLKEGREIAERTCTNPIAEQYGMAKEMGLPGTPAIITRDGRLLHGYASIEDLATALGLDSRP